MNANTDEEDHADAHLSRVAAAIAEPARARMLCCLLDGHARTATELAAVGGVAASTASVHLARLMSQQLVSRVVQGKHRYFRLAGAEVAAALEGLLVLGAGAASRFRPGTPSRLREARTCYDHMAGTLGVALHDRLHARDWLRADGGIAIDAAASSAGDYLLTAAGQRGIEALGIDLPQVRAARRRFACACLDWSERRPHLGGALGAALLSVSLRRGWLQKGLDSRALTVTPRGRREVPGLFCDLMATPR
ncbi:MAG: transcriptional regulator [Comamonadaceae bacterium]|nr:MAG: transcriptional regulator [Comamonadaceae bacterium]